MAELWPFIQSLVKKMATRRKKLYLWRLITEVGYGWLLSTITSFEWELLW